MKFQLTASQGGWHSWLNSLMPEWQFQLTASQGGWRRIWIERYFLEHFNSQPHKEADRTPPFSPLGNPDISTHSLTRRLTTARQAAKGTGVFQLTASQGGWRLMAISSTPQKPISTHSLTRRLTAHGGGIMSRKGFQLTASQGGWPFNR